MLLKSCGACDAGMVAVGVTSPPLTRSSCTTLAAGFHTITSGCASAGENLTTSTALPGIDPAAFCRCHAPPVSFHTCTSAALLLAPVQSHDRSPVIRHGPVEITTSG